MLSNSSEIRHSVTRSSGLLITVHQSLFDGTARAKMCDSVTSKWDVALFPQRPLQLLQNTAKYEKHLETPPLLFAWFYLFSSFATEVSRNDSCPDLPEIQNGWKTTSHIALVRGARITYQCDPGYDLVGHETLTCQLDLSWNSQPPFCEKSKHCFNCHLHLASISAHLLVQSLKFSLVLLV